MKYVYDDENVDTPRKRGKFNAKKTELDGIMFDSMKEAGRYEDLKQDQETGAITDLELQPVFQVVINSKKVCKYRGDFRYTTKEGKSIVEDVKGFKTPVYRLKKKLVEAQFGIIITEV